jgi:hypothetical protein
VVATSGTGFVLGSGGAVDLSMLSYTCLGTMMVAASASTLNQVGFSGEYTYPLYVLFLNSCSLNLILV